MSLHFRKASYEPGVVEFGNGSFAYLQPDGGWGFSNAGLVTDAGEALLVDTMFDTPHTRAMLDGFSEGQPREDPHPRQHTSQRRSLVRQRLVEGCQIVATRARPRAMEHETPRGLAQS